MTAQEYAMVRAVVAKISGLRLLMVGAGIGGGITSFIVWFWVLYAQVVNLTANVNTPQLALSDAILTFIPFIGLIGILSYRVNRHVSKLSRGRYTPPRDEE